MFDKYKVWATDTEPQETDEERRQFYVGLSRELRRDLRKIEDPKAILTQAVDAGVISALGAWEYNLLDEDGGTTGIQQRLKQHYRLFRKLYLHNIVLEDGSELAFEKYGHLAPPDIDSELLGESNTKPLSLREARWDEVRKDGNDLDDPEDQQWFEDTTNIVSTLP